MEYDERKCNSDLWWNDNKCWCECKNHHICKKNYIWNLATCSCKNVKYLASLIDDSVITCGEIIEEETKTVATSLNKKIQSVKQKTSIF